MTADLQRRAARVRAVVLDVDGCLTDGRLFYDARGEAFKVFNVRDNLGLALLRDAGVSISIISGRGGPIVEARARELKAAPVLLNRVDKSAALDEALGHLGVEAREVAAIGDDLLDIPLLNRVGLSTAPSDADPRVSERVHLKLDLPGGGGAVRQLCEILLKARGDWERYAQRFELGKTLA